MILNWIYLLLAIACEVTGTVMMKVSDGFTRMIPSILVAVFYILTLPFFTLALKKIDVGVAYAIWSAVGTASIAVIGYLLFKEQMNPVKITAIILIIIGVVMLNLGGVTRG